MKYIPYEFNLIISFYVAHDHQYFYKLQSDQFSRGIHKRL